jgi:hypothetical protein
MWAHAVHEMAQWSAAAGLTPPVMARTWAPRSEAFRALFVSMLERPLRFVYLVEGGAERLGRLAASVRLLCGEGHLVVQIKALRGGRTCALIGRTLTL